MPGRNQKSITIHLRMYEEIERLVREDSALYASVSDFTEAALRAEIRRGRNKGPRASSRPSTPR